MKKKKNSIRVTFAGFVKNDDEKVRDHCHVTRKSRDAAHWSCNIMQFMNSSLEKLVKNLSDNDFKYLTEEFGSKNLELLKQKDAYPYEYMGSLVKKNCLIKNFLQPCKT